MPGSGLRYCQYVDLEFSVRLFLLRVETLDRSWTLQDWFPRL